MISAEYAISRTRRGLTLGAIMRWGLIIAALLAVLIDPLLEIPWFSAFAVLMVVGALWLMLSFGSVRGTRMAADSSSLIAAGQYDLAERQIAQALDSFSIFRMVRLMSLHHLAVLRHAQSRWQDSAALCRALLTQRLGTGSGMDRSSRLILAESLLELGDAQGAYDNLSRLYQHRLSLREALSLLAVQSDYQARIGAWEPMMNQVMSKVELAELLPVRQSARTQAFFALAARKVGRGDWADWLRRRVELLVDVQALCTDRPMLSELWGK